MFWDTWNVCLRQYTINCDDTIEPIAILTLSYMGGSAQPSSCPRCIMIQPSFGLLMFVVFFGRASSWFTFHYQKLVTKEKTPHVQIAVYCCLLSLLSLAAKHCHYLTRRVHCWPFLTMNIHAVPTIVHQYRPLPKLMFLGWGVGGGPCIAMSFHDSSLGCWRYQYPTNTRIPWWSLLMVWLMALVTRETMCNHMVIPIILMISHTVKSCCEPRILISHPLNVLYHRFWRPWSVIGHIV